MTTKTAAQKTMEARLAAEARHDEYIASPAYIAARDAAVARQAQAIADTATADGIARDAYEARMTAAARTYRETDTGSDPAAHAEGHEGE